MKKIKIAQIGIGHDHACSIFYTLKNSKYFEVVGYCEVPEDNSEYDSVKEKAKLYGHFYSGVKKMTLEEIFAIKDLDAVAIETFDLALVKYAQMAAERGLHIHMDKAPGESAQDFERLLSTIKAKNLAFSLGYMYRFNPFIVSAIKDVKDGKIGKVSNIETEMSCIMNDKKRLWLKQFKGGMMQFLGCHLIDMIIRINGVPDEILPLNYASGKNGIDTLDVAFAVLKYPNSLATVKSSLIDCGGYVRRHLTISGETTTIDVRPLERYESEPSNLSTKMIKYGYEKGFREVGEIYESEVFDRHDGVLSAFASMIRGERSYEVNLELEARIHRCLLTACGIECDFKGKINL